MEAVRGAENPVLPGRSRRPGLGQLVMIVLSAIVVRSPGKGPGPLLSARVRLPRCCRSPRRRGGRVAGGAFLRSCYRMPISAVAPTTQRNLFDASFLGRAASAEAVR
ncbi:MAG: hypothetical protein QOF30_3325 [Acidimicrobiaceae bacterium]|jgi:hypothetical protein|nr:hypothetical protein [Acidimicrobiaceae bacterium]